MRVVKGPKPVKAVKLKTKKPTARHIAMTKLVRRREIVRLRD